MRLEHLQLRAEDELAVGQHAVEQRLDAKPVPGQEQAAGSAVVEAEGKHAAEALHAGRAPLLPGVEDDLGVAVGAELVAQAPQLLHQFAEIVDLAVVADAKIAVGAEHGLLAAGQVDDGQAPVGQAQPRLRVQAALVGTAVELGLVHGGQQVPVGLALSGQIEDTGNAAHDIWTTRLAVNWRYPTRTTPTMAPDAAQYCGPVRKSVRCSAREPGLELRHHLYQNDQA